MTAIRDANGQHKDEETIMKFPCDFVLKIMGRTDSDFEKKAIAIIQKRFLDFDASRIEKKFSKDKNFLSLSMTVFAQSKAQLDAVYHALTAEKSILMVF